MASLKSSCGLFLKDSRYMSVALASRYCFLEMYMVGVGPKVVSTHGNIAELGTFY